MTHFDLDTHDQPSPQSEESAASSERARTSEAPTLDVAQAAASAALNPAPTSAVVLHKDAPLFRFGH